jgi:hypothetical protein
MDVRQPSKYVNGSTYKIYVAISIPDSWSEAPGIDSRLGGLLTQLMLFRLSLSSSTKIPRRYLHIRHDRSFPHLSQFITYNDPIPLRNKYPQHAWLYADICEPGLENWAQHFAFLLSIATTKFSSPHVKLPHNFLPRSSRSQMIAPSLLFVSACVVP